MDTVKLNYVDFILSQLSDVVFEGGWCPVDSFLFS